MYLNLITAPTLEPITLAELKNHLKIDIGTLADNTAEDTKLTSIITAARVIVENITRRQLVNATWEYKINKFPSCNAIKLPLGNLSTITWVKYKDTAGTETTMTVTTDYLLESNGDQCGRVVLPYGISWPSTSLYPSNPISVKYVCGYGTTAAVVPEMLKIAIKFAAQNLWRHGGESKELDELVNRLVYNYRLHDEF